MVRPLPPPDKSGSKQVRKVRTPHGTRVTRAIVCSECNEKDNIAFAPRDLERVLCRKCAAKILGVSDSDARIHPERDWTCTECKRVELTYWRGDDPFVCTDCRQGILSHQQNRTKKAERVGTGGVLRIRRKSPDDDP